MTEPAIKQRVLQKVRRQFLHKKPPEDEDTGQHASLVPTPEQLKEDIVHLIEPSLALVEVNRTIETGSQFLNLNYRINTIQVESHLQTKSIRLTIEPNGCDILPREYYAKRLESYGDLELATLAQRLKNHRDNYPKLMAAYFDAYNSEIAEDAVGFAKTKMQAALACQELENQYAYVRMTVYYTKDAMQPVSFKYEERMLKEIDQSIETFLCWIKQHGIPKIFGGNAKFHLKRGKDYLNSYSFKPPFFHEGPEQTMYIFNKEEEKKEVKTKLFYFMDPTPEGFFMHVYIVKMDDNSLNNKVEELKQTKQKESDTGRDLNNTFKAKQDKQVGLESE